MLRVTFQVYSRILKKTFVNVEEHRTIDRGCVSARFRSRLDDHLDRDGLKMIPFIAITGNVSSGKTTLARQIQQETKWMLLSSDEIRNNIGGSGERVFGFMRENTWDALAAGDPVILDSTGMSPRFRRLLDGLRKRSDVTLTVVRLWCHAHAWIEREAQRTDREKVGFGVFEESFTVNTSPDVVICTSDKSPDQVFAEFTQQVAINPGVHLTSQAV